MDPHVGRLLLPCLFVFPLGWLWMVWMASHQIGPIGLNREPRGLDSGFIDE